MLTRMTLAEMNALNSGTLMEQLGIVYTEIGPDYLCATMPVDHRTKQPAGLLHGGASAALAETLGSMGSMSVVELQKQYIVGIEINANHIRKVTEGMVHGKATLIMRSRKLHIWEIKIHNDAGALVCLSRHTIMVLDKQTNE
ncbi:MAG: hotdog fold thioesterase [Lentimicrobium sp.]|nr:hotdog fold thioesterase [Lentimicrobium sp.]